jgi:hypothetical protein
MKQYIYMHLLFITLQATAQESKIRAYTQAEINRKVEVCQWLNSIIPQQMDECAATKTECKANDWMEQPGVDNTYVTVDSKNRPLDYQYNIFTTFKRTDADDNNSDMGKKKLTAMMNFLEEQKKGVAADKRYVATQAGIMNSLECKNQTTISVSANVVADIDLTYHKNIQPKKIAISIPTSFAMLYAAPTQYPLNENGQPENQLISDVKGDVAIIIIGSKPATTQLNWDGADSYKLEKITLHDVTPLGVEQGIATLPKVIQNIQIRIEGDKEYIEALIKQIDWAKVNTYIGK